MPKLLIDGEECPILIRDLESCIMNEKGDDVEKVKDPNDERYYMTHSSDGFGYWAAMEVPVASTQVAAELGEVKEKRHIARSYIDEAQHGRGLAGV